MHSHSEGFDDTHWSRRNISGGLHYFYDERSSSAKCGRGGIFIQCSGRVVCREHYFDWGDYDI
jgi:hypothetical protein